MDKNSEETIFYFDSSALIWLHRFYGPDILHEIWEELENLFSGGRIVSHVLVFEELTTNSKKPDNLSQWISKKRQYFKDITGVQAQYVEAIIKEFPELIDPNNERDEADPWLIAQILEDRTQLNLFNSNRVIVLVSAESEKSPHKIPAVCRHHNIRHLNLKEFFRANGWILRLDKR